MHEYCPNCEIKLRVNAKFCHSCGISLDEMLQSTKRLESSSAKQAVKISEKKLNNHDSVGKPVLIRLLIWLTPVLVIIILTVIFKDNILQSTSFRSTSNGETNELLENEFIFQQLHGQSSKKIVESFAELFQREPDTAMYWVLNKDTIAAAYFPVEYYDGDHRMKGKVKNHKEIIAMKLSKNEIKIICQESQNWNLLGAMRLLKIRGEVYFFYHSYSCGNMNCCGKAVLLSISLFSSKRYAVDCGYRYSDGPKIKQREIEHYLESMNDSLTPSTPR